MDAILSDPLTGGYDPALRRRSVRRGRERGCWLYVPAAELEAAGFAIARRFPTTASGAAAGAAWSSSSTTVDDGRRRQGGGGREACRPWP